MPRVALPPQAQGNRTDLAVPQVNPQPAGQPNGKPQAVQAPTGLPYGEHQQLTQTQSQLPLPQAAPAPPAGPPQGPPPGGQGQAPLDIAAARTAAKNFQMPNMGGLTRPTERPNEPVTAGLPTGPPSTPGAPAPQQGGSLTAMLSKLATASNSAALTQLAQRAGTMNQ